MCHRISVAVLLILMSVLSACATAPQSTEVPETQEREAAERPPTDHLIDGVFVAPGADFSQYSRLLVTDLDMSQWRPTGSRLPLRALNPGEREFFKEEYVGALVHFLVADGTYELSTQVGEEVLQVDAALYQDVMPGEEGNGPDSMDMAVMVLNISLYDSVTGDLLATLTDRQPMGFAGYQGVNPLTAVQVRRAFSQWMRFFREELDALRNDEADDKKTTQ